MPRKPNYKFERMERQKAKAAKKAARQEAKMEKAERRKAEEAGLLPNDENVATDSPTAGSPEGDIQEPTDRPEE